MDAYDEMIRETASQHAPWYVLRADNKWFTRVVVAGSGDRNGCGPQLTYSEVGKAKLKQLAAAKRKLLKG